MTSVDTRQLSRNSFFLLADVEHEGESVRMKVRNLSPGGMMAEGNLAVDRGARLKVSLRNIGTIDAVVAWVEGSRFGVAFAREIDPALARKQTAEGADLHTPRFTRPPLAGYAPTDTSKLRKV